jgi:hypothetical protein
MRAAGATEYVTKSTPSDQLIAVMRACYARRRDQEPLQAAA